MTPSGIEPATSRLVAQYLNQRLYLKILFIQNLFLFYDKEGYANFVQWYVICNLPLLCEWHIASFQATESVHIYTCR